MHEQELPSDWREREHTAVKRLFEAVGRRPTEAELTKVQEIVDAAEPIGPPRMHEQLVAQLSELPYVEGSPWRADRVQLVDPNTQTVVCSLTYRDAVVLAFEIEQTAARVMAGQWLREVMERRNPPRPAPPAAIPDDRGMGNRP
jgi:hypothetical protein